MARFCRMSTSEFSLPFYAVKALLPCQYHLLSVRPRRRVNQTRGRYTLIKLRVHSSYLIFPALEIVAATLALPGRILNVEKPPLTVNKLANARNHNIDGR